MLIKIKLSGMDIKRESLTESEEKYVETYIRELYEDGIINLLENEEYYLVSANRETLFNLLYMICRTYDVELV